MKILNLIALIFTGYLGFSKLRIRLSCTLHDLKQYIIKNPVGSLEKSDLNCFITFAYDNIF